MILSGLNEIDIGISKVRIVEIEPVASSLLPEIDLSEYTIRKNIFFSADDFTQSFLSIDELERLNGYKVLKKQIEWLVGRYLLKQMVWRVDPELDIHIAYEVQGAPYLVERPNWGISLSHSDKYAAAALRFPESWAFGSSSLRIGLDIEKIGKMPDFNFLKTAFTEKEIFHMLKSPQDVFRCWTAKEAYLKYIGKGFHENLHHVEIIGRTIFHHGTPVDVALHFKIIHEDYALSLVESLT